MLNPDTSALMEILDRQWDQYMKVREEALSPTNFRAGRLLIIAENLAVALAGMFREDDSQMSYIRILEMTHYKWCQDNLESVYAKTTWNNRKIISKPQQKEDPDA